ncbi:MAG: UDP-2,3-diacylglucosamine diphosphatase [Chloroherpetonaceae bacterium]|nr:UDP-2,3-diacylglucosamine diphosphatase [Chloroherpetonaceae bacterium]
MIKPLLLDSLTLNFNKKRIFTAEFSSFLLMFKKTYFFSDVHFGLQEKPIEDVKIETMLSLFDEIKREGSRLFMVGDILDYWMEYKHAVPKGHTRFFNGLIDLVNAGIKVDYLAGNHDFYLGSYFKDELGVDTHYGAIREVIDGKNFYIVHGDGVGKGDLGYKIFRTLVRNNFNLWWYRGLHPNLGVGLMAYLSKLSRKHTYSPKDEGEKERLIVFANEIGATEPLDYFICGHRHIVKLHPLHTCNGFYVNCGTWIGGMPTYAVFNGKSMEIRKAKNHEVLYQEHSALVESPLAESI